MGRYRLGRDNWFLVIPAILLGLIVLYTVNRMYAAGDLRRAIETVLAYRVEGQAPLEEYLGDREGGVDCHAELVSRFYGSVDVTCETGTGGAYRWRVHASQGAFAPADDATTGLMRRYAPALYTENGGGA